MHRIALALVIGIAALAVLPAAAGSPPEDVTIVIQQHFTGPDTLAGTFVASGVVADAGAYVETFRLAGRTVQGVKTLTGRDGTITLQSQGVLVLTGETTGEIVHGRWVILAGTGAYAELQGEGDVSVSVDFAQGTAVAMHTGRAHVR